jgi:uncharacterized protein YjbJ (UPF0337 family)/ElaB/YqjD/DUF883 family membrane-anchored ribosome-binding protein
MINAQELQGQWNEVRGKIKEKWGQLTNDDLTFAGGNVDQLVGRIQQRTGEARETIEGFINDLMPDESTVRRVAGTAAGYVSDAGETVRQGYEQVSRRATDAYDQAAHMVERHPTQSVLAVFGMGVLAGVVVGMLLRSE